MIPSRLRRFAPDFDLLNWSNKSRSPHHEKCREGELHPKSGG